MSDSRGSFSREKVALLGLTRNTDNFGVRVLLSATVDIVSAAHPDAEIILIDYGHRAEAHCEQTRQGPREVRLVNLRFSWRLFLPNNAFRLLALALVLRFLPSQWRETIVRRHQYLREFAECRSVYAIAGGDSFSDLYGFERLLYVSIPQLIALLLGCRLILLPQTFGPFRSPFARMIARWIIRRASRIYSRDAAGVETIRSLLSSGTPAVMVVPDVGFSMPAAPISVEVLDALTRAKRGRPLVGLNVSRLLYEGGYNRANMFGLRESFADLSYRIAAHVVSTLDASVLLIPHVCGSKESDEDETYLCVAMQRDLASRGVEVSYIAHPLDHREIKSVIGACDLFVGSRMHACIAAVSQGVPAVCLAYSGKFAGVMHPLGASATVIDLKHASSEDVLGTIGACLSARHVLREELGAKIGSVLAAARSMSPLPAQPSSQNHVVAT